MAYGGFSAGGSRSYDTGPTPPSGYRPSSSAPQYFQPVYRPQYDTSFGGFSPYSGGFGGGFGGFSGFGPYGGFGGGFSPFRGGFQLPQALQAPAMAQPAVMPPQEMMPAYSPQPSGGSFFSRLANRSNYAPVYQNQMWSQPTISYRPSFFPSYNPAPAASPYDGGGGMGGSSSDAGYFAAGGIANLLPKNK